MKTTPLKIFVSDSIGKVSAECVAPDKPVAALAFAHGAGAGMNHPFMKSTAAELANVGLATLRFNFPFSEHKKSRPDFPPVAHKTIQAAIAETHRLFPSLPIFAAGKSFGGRMSSQLLSTNSPDVVKGIVFFGFPLHAPGKPTMERAEHLKAVHVPMLFLQGTRDTLAEWKLIDEVTGKLKLATLVKFDGADHSFKKGKENLIPSLVGEIKKWVDKNI